MKVEYIIYKRKYDMRGIKGERMGELLGMGSFRDNILFFF